MNRINVSAGDLVTVEGLEYCVVEVKEQWKPDNPSMYIGTIVLEWWPTENNLNDTRPIKNNIKYVGTS